MEFVADSKGSVVHFSLYEGKERIGRCDGFNRWDDERQIPYLSAFVVEEKFRGKGLGQRLLNSIIEYYKSIGADRVALQVYKDNDRALHVYEKLGFEYVLVGCSYATIYYMMCYL